ncbi:MAG: DUF5667 domain-containing protein [Minisyncoccota bacterium]
MKNNFEKLIHDAGAPLALSETDREKMRALLREYAAMKPVRDPEMLQRASQATLMSAFLAYVRRPMGAAMAMIAILVVSSGGVAYAAEGTLPGDTLYPIKVGVLEPLRVALAITPEAKASLRMSFAEHRADEAAVLSHEGKLSPSTEASLVENFVSNANAATSEVAVVRANHPVTADLLSSNFAVRLAAYESVLRLLNDPGSHATATNQFQAAIQTQVASLAENQTNAKVANATSSETIAGEKKFPQSREVLDLQNAADAALNTSATIIGMARDTLDASSSAYARAELLHASALTEQGRVLLDRHDEAGASAAFKDSLSVTARLDVLTRAASSLGIPTFAQHDSLQATSSIETSSSSATGADTMTPIAPPPAKPLDEKRGSLPLEL